MLGNSGRAEKRLLALSARHGKLRSCASVLPAAGDAQNKATTLALPIEGVHKRHAGMIFRVQVSYPSCLTAWLYVSVSSRFCTAFVRERPMRNSALR